MAEPVVVCTVCSSGARAVDALRVNDRVFAVCDECERKDPSYIRRSGSVARIFGFDVEDVRGLLR